MELVFVLLYLVIWKHLKYLVNKSHFLKPCKDLTQFFRILVPSNRERKFINELMQVKQNEIEQSKQVYDSRNGIRKV